MSESYDIMVTLRGGQYVRILARNQDELEKTLSNLQDLATRIFNAIEKNDSAPFVNLKPSDKLGMSWIDGREMTGFYVMQSSGEGIDSEFRKRSLELQERFLKLIEKEADKGDEWKHGEKN